MVKTISVRLTEREMRAILSECTQAYHCWLGDDSDMESFYLRLATKLQGKLKANGLKQPDEIGRDATKQEVADAQFMSMINTILKDANNVQQ